MHICPLCPQEAVCTGRCPYVLYVPGEAVHTVRCPYVPYVPEICLFGDIGDIRTSHCSNGPGDIVQCDVLMSPNGPGDIGYR